MKLKKGVSIVLTVLMTVSVMFIITACGLVIDENESNIFDLDSGANSNGESDSELGNGQENNGDSDNSPVLTKLYRFEFEDVGNGQCIISNLIFKPNNTEDLTVEFPSKSPDGKEVVGIRLLTEYDVLPYMIRSDDFDSIVATVKEKMEKRIANGDIESPADERHRLEQFKAYYSKYDLDDAINQDMYDKYLEDYPVVAVTDSVHILDIEYMGPETVQKQKNLLIEYGITINDIAEANKKLYDEVINSNAENKLEMLNCFGGHNVVEYPNTVKELVFSDLKYNIDSSFLNCESAEKLQISANREQSAELCNLKSLKHIVSDNVGITVNNCPSLEHIEFIGETAYLHVETETPTLSKITLSDNLIKAKMNPDNISALLTEYKNGKYIGNDDNPYIVLMEMIDKTQADFEIHEDTRFISDGCFYENRCLTNITIPNALVGIGNEAFYGCIQLTSVSLPDSVVDIGDYAFAYCHSMTDITLSNSLTSIGDNAFTCCCNLLSLNIPKSTIHIGNQAFVSCSRLKNITVADGNSEYASDGNCLIDKSSKTLILGCADSIIPTDGSVAQIGDYAFYDCYNLTSVAIPNSVTSIGNDVFHYCENLTSIVIPDSVTSIGFEAFNNCVHLTSVTIGRGVTSIGNNAFLYCSKLVEIINRSQLNITVGSNEYGKVGYYAKEVHDGDSKIVNNNGYLFYTYDNVNYLLGYKGTPTELTLPSDYNGESYELYKYAFCGLNSLISVTISEGVKSISMGAFVNCSNLTNVTIGNDVISMDIGAFDACYALTGVYINDLAKWCSIDFANMYGNPLYHAKNLYVNGILVTDIVVPEGVTSIGDGVFAGWTGLNSIIIPDSVESIGDSAFYGCTGLTSVTICDGVASIGDSAFLGCTGLTSITIPDSVTSLGESAFNACGGLTSITIGNGIKILSRSAFSKCEGLKNVTIGNNVESIGDSAFANCSGLEFVSVGNSVNSIGSSVFYGCGSLKEIIIPESVTSIGERTFHKCTSLDRILYTGSEGQWYAIIDISIARIPSSTEIIYDYSPNNT